MSTITREELSYFAGLFDGEGNISILRLDKRAIANKEPYKLMVAVSNNVNVPLLKLRRIFGGGCRSYWPRHSRLHCNNLMWTWYAYGKIAGDSLSQIEPFLLIKQEQVHIGLLFAETLYWPRSGRWITKEAAQLRETCRTGLVTARQRKISDNIPHSPRGEQPRDSLTSIV